jgi:hypothetical protein
MDEFSAWIPVAVSWITPTSGYLSLRIIIPGASGFCGIGPAWLDPYNKFSA